MKKEKSINVLNTLIEINNDRIEGYETASKETQETDLKNLFSEFRQTSEKCKAELVNEVHNLGGTPTEGTKTTGKFFRVWMDFKAAITRKDREAILNSCEYGEDAAVDTYKDALSDNPDDLTAEQQTMLKAQLALIRADHDKVKSMRDVLVEHN
ncbi:MAG: PA2169 family four-helix-bundle protein [Bacteroidia bacterium]|nr:PA2169 family four-helix-bundle protein [Bacteroidia bacterium]